MTDTKQNRREAYEKIRPKVPTRAERVMEVLRAGPPEGMTADEILQELYKRGGVGRLDMNYVRPRLTELKKAGEVVADGSRYNKETRCKNSLWKIPA